MFLAYIFIVCIIAFCMCRADKKAAIKNKKRISERALITVSWIGGAAGMLAGMFAFSHKTKHAKFVVGVPLIIILWAVGLCLLTRFFDVSIIF